MCHVIHTPAEVRRGNDLAAILPRLGQRQDSVADQLADLRCVAVRLGMYDAADWLAMREKPRG